jgi:hypothetical protein
MKKCLNCGKFVSVDTFRCECGSIIVDTIQSSGDQDIPQPETLEGKPIRKCQNCGQEVSVDVFRCECGSVVID